MNKSVGAAHPVVQRSTYGDVTRRRFKRFDVWAVSPSLRQPVTWTETSTLGGSVLGVKVPPVEQSAPCFGVPVGSPRRQTLAFQVVIQIGRRQPLAFQAVILIGRRQTLAFQVVIWIRQGLAVVLGLWHLVLGV